MELEKRSSKGSFLQLFDWNVKSKKKLFSNKSELSENSKQGKENFNDSTISRLKQVQENGCGPSTRENYDLNYVSSVNGDDKYETRAPGVVARLMGLDALPTPNVAEPCFTTYFDSNSFRDSHNSSDFPGFRSEEHIIHYDGMRNKLDGFTKNPVEVMLQKVQNRPIERFQTEVLPPKSAKPISITHHRLLSPIKSPGFIPTVNSAYLMEVAAKIIEHSPRSLGSSSVPLRIQGLKDKVEAADKSRRIIEMSQKAKKQNATKYSKRQVSNRFQGHAEVPALLRASGTSKTASSEGPKSKAKTVSLAVQAKANVQSRDGLISVGSRSSLNQKDRHEVKHGYAGRNQQRTKKNVEKRTSMNRQSDVLRQNNHKQNRASDKERGSSRLSISQQKERKSLSSDDFYRQNKTVNKIVIDSASVSRKTNSLESEGRKDQASSMKKKSYGKKLQVSGDSKSDGGNSERSIKCNYETERCTKWDAADQKIGMDVVSFTFTSPIKKIVHESSSSGNSLEKRRSSFIIPDSCDNQSSVGIDVTSADALSMLLEKKLRELTSRVESSPQDLVHSGFLCSSADTSQDSVPTVNMINAKSAENEKKSQAHLPREKEELQCKFDCSSIRKPWVEAIQKWQGPDEVEEHKSISKNEHEREIRFDYSGPISCLEPSYSEGSCNSLDSRRSISSEGSKLGVSIEALEMIGWSSNRNTRGVEADIDLLDSATSASFGTTSVTDAISTFTSMIVKESSSWEFNYIRCVLVNAELMLEEFAVDQAHKILAPDLFDHLEDEKLVSNQSVEEDLKLERKLLFDYVGESLESRRVWLSNGSWKHWTKFTMLFRRKDWLAEELYREISGWTSMEELMVDELVDKDMSTQLGKWVDFEIEAFEDGVEIEKGIISYLVDELVDEFFLS